MHLASETMVRCHDTLTLRLICLRSWVAVHLALAAPGLRTVPTLQPIWHGESLFQSGKVCTENTEVPARQLQF